MRLPSGLTHPSPNCGPRRGNQKPRLVVLHYTAMESAQAALDRLCDPEAEVSAHYLVAEDGEILSLVPEDVRAWHAGAGCWGGCSDVNSASIGIELDNDGTGRFPECQMAALETLLAVVMERWRIPAQGVIGHSDMAPGRKSDPGAHFDWERLARQDRAVWPLAAPEVEYSEAGFLRDIRAFGYSSEVDFDTLLSAFRLRFRQGHAGAFDDRDCALAADLARRFPVDPELGRT